MATPQAVLRSNLTGLAREAAALCRADPRTSAANPVRLCFDQLLAHLIVREDAGHSLVERYEADLRGAISSLDPITDQPPWWRDDGTAPPPVVEDRFNAAATYAEGLISSLSGPPDLDAEPMLPVLTAVADAEIRYYSAVHEHEQRIVESFALDPHPEDHAPTADQVAVSLIDVLPGWDRVTVSELEPVPGLHSKEVYLAVLQDGADRSLPIVIRRDRTANIVPGSVVDEFPIMQALFKAGVPVPEPMSAGTDPAELGRPYLIMTRLPGTTATIATLSQPVQTMRQFAETLARFHDTPIDSTGLAIGTRPVRESWTDLLDEHHRWWTSIRSAASPSMEWAYRWLCANVDLASRETRLVHGDFNLKNVLVHDGRVSGLIDFELTRPGHPAEDLGAIRPEAEQVMPWAEFLAIYQRAGGADITPEELKFCDVWTAYRYRIICAMAGHVHATGRSGEIFFTLAERLESPRLLTVLVRALQHDPQRAR